MRNANQAAYKSAVQGAFKKKKVKHTKAHPGFNTVADQIAQKEGVSPDRARAMLAASTRGASAKAKKANPRLKRVKG
jgi:hypothetical protein